MFTKLYSDEIKGTKGKKNSFTKNAGSLEIYTKGGEIEINFIDPCDLLDFYYSVKDLCELSGTFKFEKEGEDEE